MKTFNIILAILFCELAGGIGSLFTAPSIGTWYAGLVKPSFNPPNWIFGPVWTTLFALMGVALYLIWKSRAMIPFFIQLALNVLWSVIFFGLHSPFFALLEIAVLWLAIFWTIIACRKVSKAAAYLLMPYLLWVSFASALTFSIWRLN